MNSLINLKRVENIHSTGCYCEHAPEERGVNAMILPEVIEKVALGA